MEVYEIEVSRDGRITIPAEVRKAISESITTGGDAFFVEDQVIIERHIGWDYIKIWLPSSDEKLPQGEYPSKRTHSRLTQGRLATDIDDSYRIQIPMGFRRETGLFDAAVWVVRGKELEIWSTQKWQLAATICAEREEITLPQRELSQQVKKLLKSTGDLPEEAVATIDTRGRTTLPAFLRRSVSHDIVITQGLDRYIALYTEQQWIAHTSRILDLSPAVEHGRKVHRVLFATAFNPEIKADGRLPIPKILLEQAMLGEQLIIVNSPSCLYLWDAETWRNLARE